MDILIIVDMQNDFIDGALGTKEAKAIVPDVAKKIKDFDGEIIYTRDTHEENYLDTQEGRNLPVAHCIRGTKGWEICPQLEALRRENDIVIDKPTFGSMELGELLKKKDEELRGNGMDGITSITLVGLCTDICVISNAMISKAALPEVSVYVDKDCCAGVTTDSHETALAAMRMCQIKC